MIEDEVPEAAPIGHNSGSMLEGARADLAEFLHDAPERKSGKTFAQRKAEFLASAAAQTVKDRDTAGDASDTIMLAGEIWDMIDAGRRERSDPYRKTHLALSEQAQEFWAPVVDAMAGLRAQIDAWTAEEDKRVAAQRAEQEEMMARLRKTATPAQADVVEEIIERHGMAGEGRTTLDYTTGAGHSTRAPEMREPRRAKIRGDRGSTISQRDNVEYEIDDFDLIPQHILQSKTVRDAIIAVVKSTVRHMGVPPGIRTVVNTTNQIK